MVKYSPEHFDRLFHALSDSTRRSMLARLSRGEASVGELALPFDVSLAAISKHLKVLEKAEMVEKTRDGRTFRCRARPEALDGVGALLEELGGFWRERLSALDTYFKNESLKNGEKYGERKKRR